MGCSPAHNCTNAENWEWGFSVSFFPFPLPAPPPSSPPSSPSTGMSVVLGPHVVALRGHVVFAGDAGVRPAQAPLGSRRARLESRSTSFRSLSTSASSFNRAPTLDWDRRAEELGCRWSWMGRKEEMGKLHDGYSRHMKKDPVFKCQCTFLLKLKTEAAWKHNCNLLQTPCWCRWITEFMNLILPVLSLYLNWKHFESFTSVGGSAGGERVAMQILCSWVDAMWSNQKCCYVTNQCLDYECGARDAEELEVQEVLQTDDLSNIFTRKSDRVLQSCLQLLSFPLPPKSP